MSNPALREQAIALLQDFPPPARSSPAIVQEIETLLATRPDPIADLTALKDKSWDVYLTQLTDYSTHTTHIYAPTTYILHSFNQNSFNDNHSQHHTSHTSTDGSPNSSPSWPWPPGCWAIAQAISMAGAMATITVQMSGWRSTHETHRL